MMENPDNGLLHGDLSDAILGVSYKRVYPVLGYGIRGWIALKFRHQTNPPA